MSHLRGTCAGGNLIGALRRRAGCVLLGEDDPDDEPVEADGLGENEDEDHADEEALLLADRADAGASNATPIRTSQRSDGPAAGPGLPTPPATGNRAAEAAKAWIRDNFEDEEGGPDDLAAAEAAKAWIRDSFEVEGFAIDSADAGYTPLDDEEDDLADSQPRLIDIRNYRGKLAGVYVASEAFSEEEVTCMFSELEEYLPVSNEMCDDLADPGVSVSFLGDSARPWKTFLGTACS